MDVVSYMNNSNIEDVCIVIEEKLSQKGFLRNGRSQISDANDLFAILGIPKTKYNFEPLWWCDGGRYYTEGCCSGRCGRNPVWEILK